MIRIDVIAFIETALNNPLPTLAIILFLNLAMAAAYYKLKKKVPFVWTLYKCLLTSWALLVVIVLLPVACYLLPHVSPLDQLGYTEGDYLAYAGVIVSIGFAALIFRQENLEQQKAHQAAIRPYLQIELALFPYALHATIKNIGTNPAYCVQYERTKTIPCILPSDEECVDIRYFEDKHQWQQPETGIVITVLCQPRDGAFSVEKNSGFPSWIELTMLDVDHNVIIEKYYPADYGSNIYIAGTIPEEIKRKKISIEPPRVEA